MLCINFKAPLEYYEQEGDNDAYEKSKLNKIYLSITKLEKLIQYLS